MRSVRFRRRPHFAGELARRVQVLNHSDPFGTASKLAG
jgi:hypothetical protein